MHNAWVEGRTAYLAWYSGGVRIVDFSDPRHPVETGYFVPPARPDPKAEQGPIRLPATPLVWGVQKHADGFLYASDINGGLYVLEHTGP
jgi:hypothetical protein